MWQAAHFGRLSEPALTTIREHWRGELLSVDREIAAIVAKAGLPGFRYLSFGNAPLRTRPDTDERPSEKGAPDEASWEFGGPAVGGSPGVQARPAGLDRGRPERKHSGREPPAQKILDAVRPDHGQAERGLAQATPAGLAETPPVDPPVYPLLADAAPAAVERAGGPTPRSPADPAPAFAANGSDFVLLRAVEEQRRGFAGAGVGGPADRARRDTGETEPSSPPESHPTRPAALRAW